MTTKVSTKEADPIPEPDFDTLKLVAFVNAIPFIAFGFMDNTILILAGDAIDTSLGVMLGISTMCAAAIGNIISDVAGILLGTAVEDFCASYLRLPTPNLTTAQRGLRSVRFANQFGCGVGIVIGCVIGMFPLWFIDSNKIQTMKRDRQLESLFEDVVNEAKTLVGAESTCLYLRVSADKDGTHVHNDTSYKPDPEGDYLFARYYVVPQGSIVPGITLAKRHSTRGVDVERSRLVQLGRGIVSRAVLTAESWNIEDVKKEPDFSPVRHAAIQNMVVVPVMDGRGHPIAVIEATNKIETGAAKSDAEAQSVTSGFTDLDEQILIALASHISVSLQTTFYQDLEQEDFIRFRDTIKILKEHGLAGLEKSVNRVPRLGVRNLFPEDE